MAGEKLIEFGVVVLLSILVAVAGSFMSYPPFAKAAGLVVFILGTFLLVLRESDEKSIGKKGLEGKSGEGSENSGKPAVEHKSKGKKRN
jgi:cadmium resistance protein CadD (predicted permease)